MTEKQKKFKEFQKKCRKEELLNSKNEWGNSDPTPKQAVKNIKYGIA